MVSLFAGIGGFELAFRRIGVKTTLMCEIDKIAKHVLRSNMPNVPIVDDICELKGGLFIIEKLLFIPLFSLIKSISLL